MLLEIEVPREGLVAEGALVGRVFCGAERVRRLAVRLAVGRVRGRRRRRRRGRRLS